MHNPTYHDMTPAIGQRVSVTFESVRVTCSVRNVKSSYGRVRLLVAPESGSGEQWVEVSRLNRPAPEPEEPPFGPKWVADQVADSERGWGRKS